MPSRFVAIVLATAVLLLAGCSRTRVGGFADSQDKKHRAYVTAWGASGRAYNDQTSKAVQIRIVAAGANESVLLERKYRVTASSLDWNATWDERDKLSVVFFDYGPGVDSSDGEKGGKTKRRVLAVNYRFDAKTGSFIEDPAK